mgnify:CR=1 FL=1
MNSKQSIITTAKHTIETEGEAILNLSHLVSDDFAASVELIYQSKGRVIITGIGKSAIIATKIVATLNSTGTPAIFLHPSESQHGDLGMVQENDILLLISNSGKTREIIELEHLVKRIYPEIKIIGLTGNPEGELANFSDVTLLTGNPKEICPLGLAPTTSTTVMTVVGDVLVVLMEEKIGFTKEQYALRHHSGYLGSKARGNE